MELTYNSTYSHSITLSTLIKLRLWPQLRPHSFLFSTCIFFDVFSSFIKVGLIKATSCAISGRLLFSGIFLLLPQVSLALLLVILIHFALSSNEWTLPLPTSFAISSLARLGVKPRLYRSSSEDFAFTYLLMLSPSSPRETLSTVSSLKPTFLQCGTHFFYFMPSLDPLLSHLDVAFAHLDFVSPYDFVI